jgi:hypothetical protein
MVRRERVDTLLHDRSGIIDCSRGCEAEQGGLLSVTLSPTAVLLYAPLHSSKEALVPGAWRALVPVTFATVAIISLPLALWVGCSQAASRLWEFGRFWVLGFGSSGKLALFAYQSVASRTRLRDFEHENMILML